MEEIKAAQPTFPWYKERLQTKYLKDPSTKPSLDSSCWRFLNKCQDDSKDSTQSRQCQANGGFLPVEISSKSSCKYAPGCRKLSSKEKTCFSRQNIMQQTRRERVAAVEKKLKQHPLILYEHYEQGMPTELFDQVLSVLDPEMCINRPSMDPTKAEQAVNAGEVEDRREPDEKQVCTNKYSLLVNESNPGTQAPSANNSYIGLQVNDDVAKEDLEVNVIPLKSPFDLLGGETDNINESAILGRLVSGIEKSPTLCPTPIQVLSKKRLKSIERKAGSQKPVYGRWYRDPKTWKRDAVESLQDPNALPEELQSQNQTSKNDEELKQMYVIQAFRQYIIRKELRVPQFMSNLFSKEELETLERAGASPVTSASKWKGTTVN